MRAAVAVLAVAVTVAGCGGSSGLSAADKAACRSAVSDGTKVEVSMRSALVAADAHQLAASLDDGSSSLLADASGLAAGDRVRVAVDGLAGAYARQATAVRASGLVSTPVAPGIRTGIGRVSVVCRSAFADRPG